MNGTMTNNTKDVIQYSTAVLMVVSGVILAFLSFFYGGYDIADGVLWYIAQALTYAGGIFGVAIYFRTKLTQSENRFERFFREREEGMRDDNPHFGNQRQSEEGDA